MKHDIKEQNRLAKFIDSKGSTALRRYESKIAELKPDDLLRAEAREMWAAFGENMTLAFLIERQRAHKLDEQRGEMAVMQQQAAMDAMRNTWAAYKVSKFPGALAFACEQLGGVFSVSDGGASTGRIGESLITGVSREGCKAGILPNPTVVIVSVKSALAQKLTKKHKIDTKTTLSWESDGFTSYAFGAGCTAYSGGRGILSLVSGHIGSVYAPFTKPSWNVAPSKALPEGCSTLPEAPADLADILGALGPAIDGKLLDRLLLG